MHVSEIMTRRAECTRSDATLQDAAERMRCLDVGALPVCDNDRLVGMLTDRDICVRSVSAGHDPIRDRVRDAMTPEIVYCFEEDDITEATHLMKENQIRRLPVLNDARRLVGIVSLGDLAVETGNKQLVGSALEAISEPALAPR